MKNLNFVDPEVYTKPVVFISKQEILAKLKENLPLENIEWFDSITNEIALTPDEANVVLETAKGYKPALLFNSSFFPDVQYDSGLPKRFFRTDLLDDERIKCIPLLFKKIGDKETFDPFVENIIKGIRAYCAQNAEFAEAYQTKLAEIRNNNGSLQERLALYVDAYSLEKLFKVTHLDRLSFLREVFNMDLIFELEQPALEMLSTSTLSPHSLFTILCGLTLVSLLQTPDGMQIPRWNEENYLCRLLLDYEITYHIGILHKMFKDYTVADVFLIICNHIKWRHDNMPQYQAGNSSNSLYKEYAEFLESQLPELFSGDIPQKYSDLLYHLFFLDERHFVVACGMWHADFIFLPDSRQHQVDKGKQQVDLVQSSAYLFLIEYLTTKIVSAINENNHKQIRDISRLFDNGNKGWIEDTDWERISKEKLELLQFRISSAVKFFESSDHAEKWQDILRASRNDASFLDVLLDSLVKNREDRDIPPLSLEDFVKEYIPLEIFPRILNFSFFQEQNEDVYQSMIRQYPGLSQKDALLDRLSPCFAAIAIKDTDKMLAMLDWFDTLDEPPANALWLTSEYDTVVQLCLCVLDKLCERHEKEHESVALICEIIFRKWMYCVPTIHDIIKKYPQVQQLIFEHCYRILDSWDAPICTPLSSHQIRAGIPARIIALHKGVWHGLKPLLIAFRKTRMEWVDESLNVNRECTPNGNSNLVQEIKSYFDFFRDSLKSLRQDMADGLSDWLKPLPESKRGNLEKRLAEFPETEQDREGFDITYTEPDPIWRYAYVRAIADLGVDVDGKGHYIHSVIDMVAKENPSEMVRTAAEKASTELKKLRNGWDGNKHSQKITLAFWWLKQASRLALNLPIDGISSLHRRSAESDTSELIEITKKTKLSEEERKRQMGIEKLMRARLRI